MKFYFSLIIYLFYSYCLDAQQDTMKVLQMPEVHVDKDYASKYKRILRRVKKVYPLALYAAKKLKEIDAEIAEAPSKRKQKKIAKNEHKDLKEDFYYVIKDLYIEEGKLLMKLIHRETGLTVSDIIKKYRGNLKAEVSESLGKIWEQNLDVKYDPSGEDWIIEQVIQDVLSYRVIIDFEPHLLTRTEFKESKKEYRQSRRELRRENRKNRKDKK